MTFLKCIQFFYLLYNIAPVISNVAVKYVSEVTQLNSNGILSVIISPLEFNHYFNPVAINWKNVMRSKLGLEFNIMSVQILAENRPAIPLNHPHDIFLRETKKENCLYRAISTILCGDDRYHNVLRHDIINHLRENPAYISRLLGRFNIIDYLWYHFATDPSMNKNADDIELLGAAFFLDVCIYKYDYISQEWSFYYKDWPNYRPLPMEQQCIYLAQDNNNYYIVNNVRGIDENKNSFSN
ncbi:uncharacterized protein LOC126901998 [Daktulosphaira vitifoliae]|uniref:uncharacterized protein LOC126901998 n=1 Tax=Daktulosphaira vitifoliae TaxID=58002 RepID=UPI0021A9C81D|nr:uncharacterized protein LOC126901998 [Daktulosphaira vitifoliae]